MAELISVPEAAEALELSPARVRLLAANGDLPAVKVGGRWLVERRGLEHRRRRGSAGGRPFAPRNAWAVLGLASGGEVADIEPVVRSRLRRALSLEGLGALAPRLERRAAMSRYSAHRGEIAHVLADDRLVATGISAVGAVGLDLVSGGEVDGYIRASVSDDFVEEHALSRAGEGEENVTLRVVPDEAWADFLDGEPYAPKAAVALDLVEDADPRSRAAGRDLIRRLDRAAR
ncbi:MAG TPA: helix-turn-helix domain-containing protein [Solirubrobacterales bacterium]|nr:helix-turn-helix domain-containing protein [Solirubrobacterales bacterium]